MNPNSEIRKYKYPFAKFPSQVNHCPLLCMSHNPRFSSISGSFIILEILIKLYKHSLFSIIDKVKVK